MSALSAQEFSEIACGAVGEQFCFPLSPSSAEGDLDLAFFAELNGSDRCAGLEITQHSSENDNLDQKFIQIVFRNFGNRPST